MHKKQILLDGCGTVLVRVGKALLDAGITNIIATKRSLDDNRRTKEFIQLNRAYKFDFYLDTVITIDLRDHAEKLGLKLKGERKALPWNDVAFVVNGMDDHIEQRIIDEYKTRGKDFLLQGGAKYDILERDFVSAPNTKSQRYFEEYCGGSARQDSCITTTLVSYLGNILELFCPDEIKHVHLLAQRRSGDPGEKKQLVYEPTPKPSHHAPDTEHVLPQLAGKIISEAQKMPWEHYHRAEIKVTLTHSLCDHDLKKVTDIFRGYDRCIYVNYPLGGRTPDEGLQGIRQLLRVCADGEIPDGDLGLFVMNVQRENDRTLGATMYVPQRSVVVLSILDWVLAKQHAMSWAEASTYTNTKVPWHSFSSLRELKAAFEEKMKCGTQDFIRVSEK